MSHPIGPHTPPPSPHPHPGSVPNVTALSQEMQKQVLTLADQLQKVLDDPSLTTQKTFLSEFAHNATTLNQTVEQALLVR